MDAGTEVLWTPQADDERANWHRTWLAANTAAWHCQNAPGSCIGILLQYMTSAITQPWWRGPHLDMSVHHFAA
jgi:hypothetical protein